MTVHDQIASGKARLQRAGIQAREADLDARLLARHVLGWDTARLLMALAEPTPPGFAAAYEIAIARRERREPTAQILGVREFWGLPFEVTSDVLVPRPETELLVEVALTRLRDWDQSLLGRRPIVADVGTGSGCVAVALAREYPGASIVATDLSEAALRVAARNVARFGVGDRVRLVRTDLLAGIRHGLDLVVSNPPYVADEETPALSPEVRDYEPHRALFGGPGGVQIIDALLAQAVPLVRPGGWIIFEFGNAQDEHVEQLIRAHPRCTIIAIRDDLQGIPRAAIVRVKSTCNEDRGT